MKGSKRRCSKSKSLILLSLQYKSRPNLPSKISGIHIQTHLEQPKQTSSSTSLFIVKLIASLMHSRGTETRNCELVNNSSPAKPGQPRWYCPFCQWRYYWSSETLHVHIAKCDGN
ncbi:hypothetical protein PCANC_11581 [Puccinia coronata f. sp. avenae]|uniref:Uncharacterized protein n=1 Tax=Puccinia coronata f. sp. avenae TaxID=200324 RepID=A0A2N5UIE7_9BASI|nr:hypothetical protein PCASD_10252 [Puccinia coronata f. sp. avenae]PLW46065.1 hypothetical protein PCANC_11581 [Puccinia coronata f. sp. avenae]